MKTTNLRCTRIVWRKPSVEILATPDAHTHTYPWQVPGARCGHIKPAAGAQVPATQGTTAPLDDTAWPFAALPHISMSPHQKFIHKWTRKSQEMKKQYFFELPVLAAEFSKFTWLINIAFWFITTSLSFCEEHVHMIFTNYGFPIFQLLRN